jgi:hypothetical protein
VQAVWYLFLFCLPVSVGLWSVLLVGGGFVNSVAAMPWEFRLAARVTGARKQDGRSVALLGRLDGVWGPLFLLVFVNLSVPLILVGPYGSISSFAAAGYLVIQLSWLARIRRAIRRIGRWSP